MTSSKNDPLTSFIDRLPRASSYWVAFSGGVDSHVLLHMMATRRAALAAPLGAVHVDHGIHPRSGNWSQHARAVCSELGVAFHNLEVDGKPRPGESPEAAARSARYRALADWLPQDALLLTAQHRDDQAETLLLQLFRGAGPRGLAAMPALTGFGRGRLQRPLLACGREQIVAYARRHRLHWVEDPSNTDTRYARNFLRLRLLPEIGGHWPGIATALARAAELQADQAVLATALGELDYSACRLAGKPDRLRVASLHRLAIARQRNVLRYWIELNRKPLPAFALLERVRTELLTAGADTMPLVRWSETEIRRYAQTLYLMSPLTAFDGAQRYSWSPRQPLEITPAGGTLSAVATPGEGLRVPAGGHIEIGFRRGGERLQPAGRHEHHTLKKLFQAWAIPPWERARVPLIYVDGDLAAVAGLCVAEGYRAAAGETGLRLQWSRLSS